MNNSRMNNPTIIRRTEITMQIKNELIQYILTNHNINWLSDNYEREIYFLILSNLEQVLKTSIEERWWKRLWVWLKTRLGI